MNTKLWGTTALAASLLNLSGVAMAVSTGGATVTPMRNEAPSMGADVSTNRSADMHDMKQRGMMGGGMMGMMSGCPMMGAATGPNGKVMMQMHGEMMRAMGDIMTKYADKLDTPPATQ